jgi:hypothetical protein
MGNSMTNSDSRKHVGDGRTPHPKCMLLLPLSGNL